MPKAEIENVDLGNVETLDLDLISRLVFSVYDVRRDSFKFKNAFTDGKSFDAMRQNYRERREISSVTIKNAPEKIRTTLSLLGFTVA